MYNSPTITAIVIAHNEAAMLPACLATLSWCDHILVIDNASSDETAVLARQVGAQVVATHADSFAQLRNLALAQVETQWLVYVDADERVTPALAREIKALMTTEAAAGELIRQNVLLGRAMRAGGWEHDRLVRVFRRDALKQWQGDVHEQPVFQGAVTTLATPLVHLTHRTTVAGLEKTLAWTPREARALYDSGLPMVSGVTLLRKGLMEFVRRFVLQRGYRDGMVGLIEVLVQMTNRWLVYIQVWELQQKPTIAEQYDQYEADIHAAWQKEPRV